MSMFGAATNVVEGYVLAIATQIVVFPWFGIATGFAEHLTIGLAFVGVSLVRVYLLRRLFDRGRDAQAVVDLLKRWCFTPAPEATGRGEDEQPPRHP